MRGIFKDTAIYSIASFIARGVGFFLIPVYTRFLTPADYGAIDLLSVFLTVSLGLFSAQIIQGVARYLPGMRSELSKSMCASTTFLATATSFSFFALICLSFAPLIAGFLLQNRESHDLIILAVPWIVSSALLEVLQSQLRFDRRARQYAVVSIVVVSISLLATIGLVVGIGLGVKGFILGQLAGILAGLGVSYAFSRTRYRWVFSWRLLGRLLSFSIPLIPSSLLVIAGSYLDRFFISTYLSISDVGIYGIGVRFASVASLLIMGMNLAITPIIIAHYKETSTPGEIADIFSVFLLLVTMLILGAIYFSRDVLTIMTTERYFGAARVIPLLISGAIAAQMYNFAPGVFIARKTGRIVLVNVVACAVTIGMNLVLVPRFGLVGASITNAASGVLVFLLYVSFGQREYPIPYRASDLAIVLGTLAIGGLLSYIIQRLATGTVLRSLWVKIVIFLILGIIPVIRATGRIRAARLPPPPRAGELV